MTATTANESVFVTLALNRSADAVEAVTCLVDDEPVACGLDQSKKKRSTYVAEDHGLPDGEHEFTVDFDLADGETGRRNTVRPRSGSRTCRPFPSRRDSRPRVGC